MLVANRAAQALGIQSGLRRSAALALAANLQVAKRQPAQETALLGNLANWAMQFTPTVCLDPPTGLLLEIEGCLGYFKGLPRLLGLVVDGLQVLEIQVQHGLASTPLAASWFAQQGVIPATDWRQTLMQLPLAQLPWPPRLLQQLHDLGLRQFGELAGLPRSGMGLRFGTELLGLLDKAMGNEPDPRQPFVPAACFERYLELSWHIEQVEALGFVMRRLLLELAAFLHGRGLGVQHVVFRLAHEGGGQSELPIGFGKLTRSTGDMFAITRERLAGFRLTAPVHALVLKAETLHRLDAEAIGLFGDGQTQADLDLLHARLSARLGEAAVRQLACVADHRPERAWCMASDSATVPAPLPATRPGWLLAKPIALAIRNGQPWHGELLTLLSPAERIESGWWEGESVARDYFQAGGPSGRRYWIYRQRIDGAWFLHGLFA
ncbi:hypothetical protein CSQ89_16205 [Chitinimonas sp. BJB300]|nr:hypothetical protein CSQ89_16205 [Chitinimonas sp. BJB300]